MSLRRWFLYNNDTLEVFAAQFEAEDVSKDKGAVYAGSWALNRQNEILQFLHGKTEKITFTGRLYSMNAAHNIDSDIAKLESWCERDSLTGRPPVLTFWIGKGFVEMLDCVLEDIPTSWGRPTRFGGLRDVSFGITLRKFVPFSLEDGGIFETRYHRAKRREYYEWLTLLEYRNPLLGDVIRKRNPTNPNLSPGDVVKLPSIEAIRKEKVEPKSIPLATGFERKDTPQRALRLEMFDRRGAAQVSHVLTEY